MIFRIVHDLYTQWLKQRIVQKARLIVQGPWLCALGAIWDTVLLLIIIVYIQKQW